MKKYQIFDKNHGQTPLEKLQNFDFLKSMFRKACFLNRTYPNIFSFLNLTQKKKDTEISDF